MTELEGMSFEDKLKLFQQKTDEMGSREARVGFFFRNDPDKEVGLLSETYCACVKTSKPRTYVDRQIVLDGAPIAALESKGAPRVVSTKRISVPGMLATNRAIWHGGVVHFGGPDWHESKTEPGKYATHGGKDFKPEGNLRDNKETDQSRNIAFNKIRPVDHQLLTWGLELFNVDHLRQNDDILFPKVRPPTVLSPVPMNRVSWLVLRQGETLDKMVELIVNLRRYRISNRGVSVCAPANGVVKRNGQGYKFHSDPEPDGSQFETDIDDPSREVQFYIEQTFGAMVRVELFPLFAHSAAVASDQALYTPIREQAANPTKKFTLSELKKLPCYEALQYIVVLSCTTNIGGMPYVDSELAFGDQEPLIQMSHDFPRVQRIHNVQEAFKSRGLAHAIDMLDVPHRVHMRKFKEMHEKEKAAKQAAIARGGA